MTKTITFELPYQLLNCYIRYLMCIWFNCYYYLLEVSVRLYKIGITISDLHSFKILGKFSKVLRLTYFMRDFIGFYRLIIVNKVWVYFLSNTDRSNDHFYIFYRKCPVSTVYMSFESLRIRNGLNFDRSAVQDTIMLRIQYRYTFSVTPRINIMWRNRIIEMKWMKMKMLKGTHIFCYKIMTNYDNWRSLSIRYRGYFIVIFLQSPVQSYMITVTLWSSNCIAVFQFEGHCCQTNYGLRG